MTAPLQKRFSLKNCWLRKSRKANRICSYFDNRSHDLLASE